MWSFYIFNHEYFKVKDFSYGRLKSPEKQMCTVWDIQNNKENLNFHMSFVDSYKQFNAIHWSEQKFH